MTLQIYDLKKGFGIDELFNHLSFELKPNEKMALIGRNGCGKTTLLKIIAGQLDMDAGQIFKPKEMQIGYLSQSNLPQFDLSVQSYIHEIYRDIFRMEQQLSTYEEKLRQDHSEEVLNQYANLQQAFELAGGYTYQSEMDTVLSQFGFTKAEYERSVMSFSGGEKTRLAFARLLLSKPDVLILDEPTNHLDLSTIEWLETYLKNYPRSVLFVSHDRMFIDRIAKVILELEDGELTRYPGNYSNYLVQKALNLEKQASAYTRQQKDIQRLEQLIEKFRYKKNKAKFAQSKIKYLDRMDRIDPVKKDSRSFHGTFHARLRGGKHVLTLKEFKVGYDSVLSTINLELLAHQHTAIVGDNGIGKSTFLRTLLNEIPALGGDVLWGHQIELGYFDQEQVEYQSQDTVLEDLWNAYPELTMTEVRTVLGSFLFTADDVFKEVQVLSGGEKVRLALAKLMLKQANLLILDEPTNHLDIPAKEALEKALAEYEGTLLFVSHDRYFIQKMAKQVLKIEKDSCKLEPLETAFVYEEKINDFFNEKVIEVIPSESKQQSKSRLIKQIQKIEAQISERETLLEEKRQLRFDPEYYHDHIKMKDLDEEIDEIHNQIAAFMKDWESLHESIERT
jgi:ATP-binding cassette, subfamily F, member 3